MIRILRFRRDHFVGFHVHCWRLYVVSGAVKQYPHVFEHAQHNCILRIANECLAGLVSGPSRSGFDLADLLAMLWAPRTFQHPPLTQKVHASPTSSCAKFDVHWGLWGEVGM